MKKFIIFIIFIILVSLSYAFPGMTEDQTTRWVKTEMQGGIGEIQKQGEELVISYGIGTLFNTRVDMFDRYEEKSERAYFTKIVVYAAMSIDEFLSLFKNYKQKNIAKDFSHSTLDYKRKIRNGVEAKYIGKKYIYKYYLLYFQNIGYSTILELYSK